MTPALADPAGTIKHGLDQAEALAPGRGQLDLHVLALPSGVSAAIDLEEHVSQSIALYGTAWAGARFGAGGVAPDVGALAGVRLRW